MYLLLAVVFYQCQLGQIDSVVQVFSILIGFLSIYSINY